MIKKLFAPFVLIALGFACGNDDNKAADATAASNNNNKATTPTPAYANGSKNCYAKMEKKDTVLLSYVQLDSMITGDLVYKFHEKDRNMGTINGVVHGDTIVADFSFISEGVNSVRQVVFLKQANTLTEGFGDVEDRRGKMVYRDISGLTFDNSVQLTNVDCDKMPALK